MRRSDYLNPPENQPVNPAEESIYDHVMNVIRIEVDKASRDFETIADTPEHRLRLKSEITKAIQLAIINYIKDRGNDPMLPPNANPLTPEALQEFMDAMRRVDRTRETVAPMWPDWTRYQNPPLNPTPPWPTLDGPNSVRPIHYGERGGAGDNNYYMTNATPFALYTTSRNMNMTYSSASALIDSNNNFNRKLIDEIWVEAFTGIMNHETK